MNMRRTTTFLAVAATLVSVAPAFAQGGGGGRMGRGMMRPPENSVTWIISKKADFNGTDEQIKALELVAKKLDDDTKELRDQILKALPPEGTNVREMPDAERQALMAKLQEVRPAREEFNKRDAAAVEEALKLLKEEQQVTVKTLLEERAAAGRGRRGGGSGR